MPTPEQDLERELFDPTNLTEEATMAASPNLLSQLNTAPKRRGRPPGSRNKVKPDPGQIGQGLPQQLVVPGRPTTPGRPPAPPKEPDPAAIAKAKKEKTEAYTKRILDEANDNIMLAIISFGLPTDMLYQPGKAPAEVQVDGKYTPLGNMLAIKPSQAKALASFAAEAEFTAGGQRIATGVGTGYGPLIVKGLFALGAAGQYMRGIATVRKQLEPLLRARQAHMEMVRQQEANPGGNVTPMRTGGLQ